MVRYLQSFLHPPNKSNASNARNPPFSESPFEEPPSRVKEDDPLVTQAPSTPDGYFDHQVPILQSGSAGISPVSPRSPYSKEADKTSPRTPSPSSSAENALVKAEREPERAPEWLAIFFDLAWTATFSNLTSNTELTTKSTLWAYIVFFVLAWWLWAAQVAYNVKVKTTGKYHRAMMLAHLFIFGALSAFTANFSPFSHAVDPKMSSPEEFPQDEYTRKSMLGISGLFACTRFLLALSYARILYYAWEKKKEVGQLRRRLTTQIVTYLVSCVLFAAAFGVVKNDLSPKSFWIRLALWLCGIAVEVSTFIISPEVETRYLRNEDTMGDRLTTLTTVILGEGINSIAGALVFAASLIGFLPNAGGATVSAGLVIAFAFSIYIAGPRKENNGSKMTILLHFPLHLSLIVLLEALKNLLVLLSVIATIQHFSDRANTPKKGETIMDALDAAYGNLGLDLKAIAYSQLAYGNLTQDDVRELVNKVAAQAYLKIFQNYQLASDEFIANFTTYIRTDGGQARFDHPDAHLNNFTIEPWITDVLATQQISTVWIPISSAVFMCTLGVLILADEPERRQRYATFAAVTRMILGLTLGLIATSSDDRGDWAALTRFGGLSHIVAAVFFVQLLLDQFFAWITKNRLSAPSPPSASNPRHSAVVAPVHPGIPEIA
ncbi:hypothetical protein EXIGLDRAFT_830302 [Exidia glandulosa HHB12029]|uniref:Low temperature requirement A n=1 Tax=Exidia glandulosa HHB12029 TaxID=1314781 RepID=A0A165NRT0_EXIGL|nr:hypothetical protein EXIGLDRAFT_830302 [Exidia glandulosa HHB12029]